MTEGLRRIGVLGCAASVAVLILGSALALEAQRVSSDTVLPLNSTTLATLLRGLGYLPEVSSGASGNSIYRITVNEADWKVPVTIVLSGDGRAIVLSCLVGTMSQLGNRSADFVRQMMEASWSNRPVHTSFDPETGQLHVNLWLDNRGVTPEVMRTRLGSLVSATVSLGRAFSAVTNAGRQSDSYEAEVDRQLNVDEDVALEQGYRRIDRQSGRLKEGEATSFEARLEAGWMYLVTAACDDDCGELGLALLDGTGRPLPVGTDTDRRNAPLAVYIAPVTQSASIRVTMISCGVSPCVFGVQLFRKPSSTTPASGGAPDRYESEVRDKLAINRLIASVSDMSSVQLKTGWLMERESTDVTVQMTAGCDYMLAGECDSDCRHLELRLLDASGRLLATAKGGEPASPLLSTSQDVTRSVRIRVTMISCVGPPCYFGLEVFRKLGCR